MGFPVRRRGTRPRRRMPERKFRARPGRPSMRSLRTRWCPTAPWLRRNRQRRRAAAGCCARWPRRRRRRPRWTTVLRGACRETWRTRGPCGSSRPRAARARCCAACWRARPATCTRQSASAPQPADRPGFGAVRKPRQYLCRPSALLRLRLGSGRRGPVWRARRSTPLLQGELFERDVLWHRGVGSPVGDEGGRNAPSSATPAAPSPGCLPSSRSIRFGPRMRLRQISFSAISATARLTPTVRTWSSSPIEARVSQWRTQGPKRPMPARIGLPVSGWRFTSRGNASKRSAMSRVRKTMVLP